MTSNIYSVTWCCVHIMLLFAVLYIHTGYHEEGEGWWRSGWVWGGGQWPRCKYWLSFPFVSGWLRIDPCSVTHTVASCSSSFIHGFTVQHTQYSAWKGKLIIFFSLKIYIRSNNSIRAKISHTSIFTSIMYFLAEHCILIKSILHTCRTFWWLHTRRRATGRLMKSLITCFARTSYPSNQSRDMEYR